MPPSATLYDALDRRDEAFAAWTRGKAISRGIFADLELGVSAAAGMARIEDFIDFASSLSPRRFPPPSKAATRGPREHVFLLGFPRSGTTLLEQVLGAHPDVVTLEERPFLDRAVSEFFTSRAAFQRLLDADDALLDPFRDLYWQLVRDEGLDRPARSSSTRCRSTACCCR